MRGIQQAADHNGADSELRVNSQSEMLRATLLGGTGGSSGATPAAAVAASPRSTAARNRMRAAAQAFRFGTRISSAAAGTSSRLPQSTFASPQATAAPRRPRSKTSLARSQQAASHVEDAFTGEVDDAFKRPRLQKLYSRLLWLRRLNLVVYIILGFFEVPSWCYSAPGARCDGPRGEKVPMAGLPVLPETVSQLIELGCLWVLAGELVLKRLFKGADSFWHNYWNTFKIFFITFAAVDVCSFFWRPEGLLVGPGTWPLCCSCVL